MSVLCTPLQVKCYRRVLVQRHLLFKRLFVLKSQSFPWIVLNQVMSIPQQFYLFAILNFNINYNIFVTL